MKIVIAGGGTAGHVFPALALADTLASKHGAKVAFVGSAAGQEATLVPRAGYEFDPVRADPLLRELSMRAARAPFVALRSVRDCAPLVAGADVVVGMGGYVSAPAVLAARRARVPIALHEQNAVPGLANRMLARTAAAVGVAFRDAMGRFPRRVSVRLTGNPVRASILEAAAAGRRNTAAARQALDLDPGRTTVVVLGGSQGALHLNETVAGAVDQLRDRADLQLLVLTGAAHVDGVTSQGSTGLLVRAVPFLDRMELAYMAADLVVARAGASTIAEITVCGIPAILVPYPHATGNHQEANARELERTGAAEVLLDAELSPQVLARRILGIVQDVTRRQAMGERAAAWSNPGAAEDLASMVMEVAGG